MKTFSKWTGMALALPLILAAVPPISAQDELSPTATITLRATVPDLIFAPKRNWIYLFNSSEGKVQRIDPAKRRLDTVEAEVMEGTERLTMSPDGKWLYTCASPQGHKYSVPFGANTTGKIQVIDAASLTVKSTFTIPLDPADIKAGAGGHVYITGGSGQHSEVVDVDVTRKSIVGKLGPCWMGSYLEITPDGKRLYHCSLGISPNSISPIWLGAGSEEIPRSVRSDPKTPIGGWFYITPDGKYVVMNTGTVLRLARNRRDDLKPVAKIERNLCAATDKGASVLFVGTPDGALKVYTYPSMEVKDSYMLKAPACRMLLDGTSGTLYCAVELQKPEGIGFRSGPARP